MIGSILRVTDTVSKLHTFEPDDDTLDDDIYRYTCNLCMYACVCVNDNIDFNSSQV